MVTGWILERSPVGRPSQGFAGMTPLLTYTEALMVQVLTTGNELTTMTNEY